MNQIACPLCTTLLVVKPARGRKSGKPFIMLVCPENGRHMRAFISDQKFVERVIAEAGLTVAVPPAERRGRGTQEGGVGRRGDINRGVKTQERHSVMARTTI